MASCKMCQFCIMETGLLDDGCYDMASAAALTRRMLRHRLSLDVVEG